MHNLLTALTKQKKFSIKSEGVSMRPILNSEDIIYYEKIIFKKVKTNDIVFIKKNQKLFTHRVIYKNDKYLITKGDNNLESDGQIRPQNLIAKAYQIKRNDQILDLENIYLVQSTLYFQEIVKIKKAFEKEKIDFVFLKGLPIHLYYEKTHPRRIYLDCDVLIAKKHFDQGEGILIQSGYKKTDSSLSKTQKNLKNKDIECAYYKIINGFQVVFDIHLEAAFMMTQLGKLEALYPQKLIDQLTDKLLRTKIRVQINGEYFFILNTSYLILYLALHFFHHNFQGAFRLEFINHVISMSFRAQSRNLFVFTELLKIIQKYRLQNFVYPTFFLLNKYYHSPKLYNFSTFKHLNLNKMNIFDDEPRIKSGINRFKNLFLLSPNNIFVKLLIVLNLQVIYSIAWSLRKKF